jgi:hypothetical protein
VVEGMGNELSSCQTGHVREIRHGERCRYSSLALIGSVGVELFSIVLDFKLWHLVLGAENIFWQVPQ